MIRIDIATLFPQMCEAVLSQSIVGRGRSGGFIEINCHDIRRYAGNKHNRVDDKPYGGGTGMVMQAQPIYDCITDIKRETGDKARVIYMSPQGQVLTQKKVKELAALDNIIILCGHYEGVDQRVLDELCAEEISVGDYVLTGGEIPAVLLADAVARLQEGVLPNSDAYSIESHYSGLLEHPQYSRPEVWRERRVPEVLLCGDHAKISEWQNAMSLEITMKKRPDMLYNRRKNCRPYGKYIRIQPKNGGGLFSLGWKLVKNKAVASASAKRFVKIDKWFKEFVPSLPNGVMPADIYYKTDTASEHIEMLMEIKDMLMSAEILCDVIMTDFMDSQIIYEDEIRVAVSENT